MLESNCLEPPTAAPSLSSTTSAGIRVARGDRLHHPGIRKARHPRQQSSDRAEQALLLETMGEAERVRGAAAGPDSFCQDGAVKASHLAR
jgi:hypothetical protein